MSLLRFIRWYGFRHGLAVWLIPEMFSSLDLRYGCPPTETSVTPPEWRTVHFMANVSTRRVDQS